MRGQILVTILKLKRRNLLTGNRQELNDKIVKTYKIRKKFLPLGHLGEFIKSKFILINFLIEVISPENYCMIVKLLNLLKNCFLTQFQMRLTYKLKFQF